MFIQKSFKSEKENGRLYLVATPIGNLEDITYRALNILKEVDYVAAEDTRQSLKLLNHFSIQKSLISYHEHNKESSGRDIISKLEEGFNIALVSDAGMPAISDPGYELTVEAVAREIPVIPIPGANAALSGLIASGLPTKNFMFLGFLPRDKKELILELERVQEYRETLVMYEAPHRIKKTLASTLKVLGNRRLVLVRELTKIYEEFIRGTIEEVLEFVAENQLKGEISIIIEGFTGEAKAKDDGWWQGLSIKEHVEAYIEKSNSVKDAMKMVAKDRSLSKREVYGEYHEI